MRYKLHIPKFLSQWGRVSRYAVALCWLTGLLLGFCAAKSAGTTLIWAVKGAAYGSVSLLRLLLICVLPFLICCAAIYLNENWLLLFGCLYEAFSFGFCAVGIGLTFGSAGWLIRFLLLFSDCMSLPAMLFICLFFAGKHTHIKALSIVSIVYATAVAVFDYLCIVPLLQAAIT